MTEDYVRIVDDGNTELPPFDKKEFVKSVIDDPRTTIFCIQFDPNTNEFVNTFHGYEHLVVDMLATLAIDQPRFRSVLAKVVKKVTEKEFMDMKDSQPIKGNPPEIVN